MKFGRRNDAEEQRDRSHLATRLRESGNWYDNGLRQRGLGTADWAAERARTVGRSAPGVQLDNRGLSHRQWG
jgi:hypothetical protein